MTMKTLKSIFTLAFATASSMAIAQDANLVTHADSVNDKCKENNSIFYQFAKNKDYVDAYQPWL